MIEQLAYSLGVISGMIGMCMAVYMQLISPRSFDPKLVILFWLFGTALVVINLQVVWTASVSTVVLQVAMYTVLIAGEVYIGSHLLKHRNDPVVEVIDDTG